MASIWDDYGKTTPSIWDAYDKSQPGDTSRGFQTAIGQTVPIAKGLVGLAGATAEKVLGEGGVSTAVKDWGLKGYQEGMQKLQPLSRENDDVTVAWDKAKQGDVGALVDWAQYALGYGTAQILETAAVGVGGALAGGAVGGGAGILAKEGTKSAIRTMVESQIAKRAAQLEAGGMAAEAAGKAATKSLARDLGAAGALGVYNIGQEAGSIYPTAEKQAQEEGRALTGADLARVYGSAVVAGASESATDLLGLGAIAGRIKIPGTGRGGRAAAGATIGAGIEAGQETFQTAAERFGAQQPLTGDEATKEYINAAAMAALPGGVVGGLAGGLSKARPTEVTPVSPPAQTPPSPAQDVAQAAISVLQAPSIDEAITAAQKAVEPDRGNLGLSLTDSEKLRPSAEPTAMELAFQKAGVSRGAEPESPGFVPPALAAPPTDVVTDVTAMSDVALDLAGRLTRSEERRVEIQTEQQRRVDLQSAAQTPEAQVAEPGPSIPTIQSDRSLPQRNPWIFGLDGQRGEPSRFDLRELPPEQIATGATGVLQDAANELERGAAGPSYHRLLKILGNATPERRSIVAALWPEYSDPNNPPLGNQWGMDVWTETVRGDPGARLSIPELSGRLRGLFGIPGGQFANIDKSNLQALQQVAGRAESGRIGPAAVTAPDDPLDNRQSSKTGELGPIPRQNAPQTPIPANIAQGSEISEISSPAAVRPPLAPPITPATAVTPPLQSEPIPAPAVAGAAVSQQQPPLPAVPIPLVPPTKVDRIGGKPVKDLAAWQLKQFTQVGGAGVKARAQAELDRRDEESGATALRDALADPNLRTSIKAFKGVIGRDDVGGRVIVDMVGADTAPGMGDVIGRTQHLGDPRWFGRPDQSLSAPAARAAIDKALAGKDLGDREQRFLNYVVEQAKAQEAELAEAQALADREESKVTGSWATMTEQEKNDELDSIFGPDTHQGLSAPGAEESTRAPEGEARQEVPAEAEVDARPAIQSRGEENTPQYAAVPVERQLRDPDSQRRDGLELAGETEAALKAREAREVEQETKAIADREREVFALQAPSGTVSAQPLSEPKNQTDLFAGKVSGMVDQDASANKPAPAEAGKAESAFKAPTVPEIVAILRNHPLVKLREKVKRAFLIGSFASGKQNDQSDVDILLEVPRREGFTPTELDEHYRQALRKHFVRHNIKGKDDSVHPQWAGRRVDIYFTYDADTDNDGRPRGELNKLSAGTQTPAPVSTQTTPLEGGVLLSDITVRIKAVEAETGRTLVLNEKADIALKSVDEQISTAKRLLECLGS